MKNRSTFPNVVRTLSFIVGVLALALFTQLTVSHADPSTPRGASTLGDFVWHDSNVNGTKDESVEWGSSGIDGVVVKLYLDDNDGVFEPGGDDTLVNTLTTGDDSSTTGVEHGWYDFLSITANGNIYWVEIPDSNFASGGALEHYVYTGDLASEDYSGEEPRVVILSDPIMDYNNADFGYALPGIKLIKVADSAPDGTIDYINSGDDVQYTYTITNTGETHLSDIVIRDDNGTAGNTADDFTVCTITGPLAPNASQSCTHTVTNVTADVTNIATVTANPTSSDGTDLPGDNVTDSDDADVVLYASLGDYVWEDTDADGVQDAGESPIQGVTVKLYKDVDGDGVAEPGADDGAAIATDTTDASGLYGFDDLVPGDYFVQFTKPTGYDKASPSTAGSASDPTDSDADATTGLTDVTTLISGENDPTWDAGFYKYAKLGDYVWEDKDADGVQDTGESAIQGVTVKLYKDVDGDGVAEPGADDGAAIATDTTDASGLYEFDNLVPGDYFVQFTKPTGYDKASPSTAGSASDPTDSDADATTGVTNVTTLDSGENDPTWDAGFYKLASLGDKVWWDLNEDGIQDAGEPGIKGVTVTLKDGSGTTIATDITDANGDYSFTDLEPGNYSVVFTKPNNDWTISPKEQGTDDAKDSNADTATGQTDTTTLSSGEDDDTVDAGMSIPSSYTITKKNTTAASELTPGDPISFTITIKNTGKTWLAVLPLRDTYDTTYLAYVNADTASDDNVDDGTIDWTDLTASYGNDLAPGASFSVVVNFTAKHHTQNLPNHETINTATAHDVMTDPDGPTGPNGATGPLPNQSDDDPVTILNPVGESMSSFAALVAGNAVQIRWQSASEASILGFNMLRSANGGSFEQVNDSLIFAQYAGADLGASYRFVDRSVSDDSYNYVLEIVFLDGSVAHYGAVQVNLDTSF